MKTKITQTQRFKGLKIIVLLTGMILSTFGFTQNPPSNDMHFNIEVKLGSGQEISALSNFTEILSPHSGTGNTYCLSYPNAQNPELLKFYNLSGQGNEESMIVFLTSSGLFEKIEIENDIYTLGCVNPLPQTNDTWFAQNWAGRYHLDLIEANCAWSITTGNPNIIIGIADTEFDENHEDFVTRIANIGGPISGGTTHGTHVAGCAAVNTNNNKGIAAIGYNCRLDLERVFHTGNSASSSAIRASIWNLYQRGVPIINVSWTGSGLDVLAAQEITDNGTVLILGAGNTPNAINHSIIANIPGVIVVSGVNQEDKHGPTNHTHNQFVDLCAPSVNIPTLDINNGYTSGWGTSYASPTVAGIVGLMLSVNSCLTPSAIELILKNTTDPIADAANYPGTVGTGRVNAFKAVKTAQAYSSPTLDLFIKDRPEDFGVSGGYHWQAHRDESPDIWVRNQPDGLINQTSENPDYDPVQPVYVYVRVRNKSCVDFVGASEQISLYWSKASSWSSWPQNWDGSNPTTGNLIGTQVFSGISAGNETIFQFTWHIINPFIHKNWSTCLLARIENSGTDPITIHPNHLADDVYFNNNIAMRNVTIVNDKDGAVIGEVQYPRGTFMYIGNPIIGQDQTYNIKFMIPETVYGASINEVAEISIIFDDQGWDIIKNYITPNEGIVIDAANKTIISRSESFQLTNVLFPSETRVPIYLGFSFLTDEMGEKQEFKYHVNQYMASDGALLGGEHFIIVKPDRNDFDADAGSDKIIKKDEIVTVSATDISESATYNWYDMDGNLIFTGEDFSVSPQMTETYKLEVIANADGFKDYDEVIVEVKDCYIDNVSPNPASNDVIVDYKIENTTSGYIMVLNATATTNNNYMIDVNQTQTTFNVANFQQGTYSVILVCDGVAVDMRTLIVQ